MESCSANDDVASALLSFPFKLNSNEMTALKNPVLNATPTATPTAPTPTSSTLYDEFGVVYNRIRCKDRVVWERMHSLARDSRDPLAQAMLAIGYCRGFIFKDVEKGLEFANQCISWLHLQTDKNSFYCLSQFYNDGIGVDVDKTEANRYCRLAAEAGSELGQLSFGYYCRYFEKNDMEAAKWYKLSAEAGFCVAQCNIGILYRDGTGVTQDFGQAVNWFRLAAEQGHCNAQFELGIRYFNGQGVEVDFIEAVRWFQSAAENHSDADAQRVLGQCFEWGHGVPVNEEEMIRWYRLAVAQNEMIAQYNLGLCYEIGKGVPKDIIEATRLYTLSSEQGNKKANKRLEKLLVPSKK